MNKINNKRVTVATFDEFKTVLEDDNGYEYVYLENDINLESGITINPNKNKITIDGMYLNVMHTLTGMNSQESSDTIVSNSFTKEVLLKNMKIVNVNVYGIVCVPEDDSYDEVVTIYDNVTFNGTKLSFNPYGTVKISDCVINIADTDGVKSQAVCDANRVIIGGKTNISSSSSEYSLFSFKSNSVNPSVIFLCKSDVILSTDEREFMRGTYRLNFTILHDTSVHLTTANGFSPSTVQGVNNVLIDERASFIFIEKSHQRIPMWAIFGSLTLKEGSSLQVINSYANTPSDNYNIHFKGTNCKMVLDNPKSFVIYTKNANVIYTDNPLSFNIRCSRINMWQNSVEVSAAGDINNLPDYSWYKENDLLKMEGTITSSLTSITSYNITASEMKILPDIGNFTFQNRKQFSIGNAFMNVHPINSIKSTISGHTSGFADVLIKYDGNTEIVNADDDGLFEYNLPSSLVDGTKVELVSNVAGSFIYGTRTVTTPFDGELSLLDADSAISFSLVPMNDKPIFPKLNDLMVKIVDSRINSSDWKLYAYVDGFLTSSNGFVLEDALVFKKFDDEVIVLTTTPSIVFTGSDNGSVVSFKNLNWSKEKGPLLDLTSEALEANEEYFANIYFDIEE